MELFLIFIGVPVVAFILVGLYAAWHESKHGPTAYKPDPSRRILREIQELRLDGILGRNKSDWDKK
jgi:hypothetical protein